MRFNGKGHHNMNELRPQIDSLALKTARQKNRSVLGTKKRISQGLRRKRTGTSEMTSFNSIRGLPILQALLKDQKFKRFDG